MLVQLFGMRECDPPLVFAISSHIIDSEVGY